MKFKEAINFYLTEAKKITIDIDMDWSEERAIKKSAIRFGIKIKETGRTTADITGQPEDIKKYLLSSYYGMDEKDIEEIYPELGKINESKKITKVSDFMC